MSWVVSARERGGDGEEERRTKRSPRRSSLGTVVAECVCVSFSYEGGGREKIALFFVVKFARRW